MASGGPVIGGSMSHGSRGEAKAQAAEVAKTAQLEAVKAQKAKDPRGHTGRDPSPGNRA